MHEKRQKIEFLAEFSLAALGGTPLVNCPTPLTCIAHCVLCICHNENMKEMQPGN